MKSALTIEFRVGNTETVNRGVLLVLFAATEGYKNGHDMTSEVPVS